MSAMKHCPSPPFLLGTMTAIWLYNQVIFGSILYRQTDSLCMALLSSIITGNIVAYTSPIGMSLGFGAIKWVCVFSPYAQCVIKHKSAIEHVWLSVGKFLKPQRLKWIGCVWVYIGSISPSRSQSRWLCFTWSIHFQLFLSRRKGWDMLLWIERLFNVYV